MRDGSTRRTSPQSAIGAIDIAHVHDWRRHGRLDDLRTLTEGAIGLTWSHGLIRALLEELHISDDFDALVGRVALLRASQYPRLLAIALLLRHSWCPQDLTRTATRLGLRREIVPSTNSKSRTTRDRGDRHHASTSASPSGPRPRVR